MFNLVMDIIRLNNLNGKITDAHTIINLITEDKDHLQIYINESLRFKTTALYHSYISKIVKRIAVLKYPQKIHTLNICGNCSANAMYRI